MHECICNRLMGLLTKPSKSQSHMAIVKYRHNLIHMYMYVNGTLNTFI